MGDGNGFHIDAAVRLGRGPCFSESRASQPLTEHPLFFFPQLNIVNMLLVSVTSIMVDHVFPSICRCRGHIPLPLLLRGR